jgi:uncharacterized membrane protein
MLEFLVILVGFIALLFALNARKRAMLLQLEVTSQLTRISRLEDEVDTLRQRRPDAPRPEAPFAAPQVREALPVVAAPSASEAEALRPPEAPEPPRPEVPTIVPPASVPEAGAAAPAVATNVTLEERLGTRWAVWVGGAALALGGLLFVQFSIEQGIIGPGVRIALGALFSLALIGAGEWFRRTERGLPTDAIPAAHVPSILTAAGTVSVFGTVYAAHAVYGFIGPAAAFILLGIIGIATMLAAALHGPALAGLGLAGSLAAPLLVTSQAPNPWPLVIYLAVVAAAAYALARFRRWLWLAASVVVGVFFWGLALLGQVDANIAGGWASALFVHAGAQLALAAAFMALEPHLATRDEGATPDWIATGALAALSMLAVLALAAGRFDAQWTLFAAAVIAILALVSWRSAPAAAAAALAGCVSLGAIATWPGLTADPEPRLLAPAMAEVLRVPDNVSSFMIFTIVSSLAIGLLATLRLERGRALPTITAGLYGLAAIVPSLLALMLAYLRVTQFDRSIPFALFSILLAADFYLAGYRFGSTPEAARTPASRLATGAFAAGVAAAVTLAFVMTLERGYLTVAFAVTALTTAIIAERQRLPLLRAVVVAIGFIVLGRLIWDPRIMGADVGTVPIFNWLLIGYGVPAICFLAAGYLLKARRKDLAVRICDALGVLFAALLVFYEIRHALNGGDPLANTSGHVEQGLFALMSLCFAYVLMRLDLSRANPVFRFASLAAGVLSAAFIVFGLGIVENPLLNSDRILGVPVFSSLMLAYLVPGLAAVLLARSSRGVRPDWYVLGAAVLAMLLLFGYVTLEVRHLFQGDVIALWKPTSQPEIWSYSAAWLMLGLIFLAYGIVRGTREPRLASAALVFLSVIKVFLYDLTGTGGLWRALSVICLGVVLIGIGLAYQKLVFAHPPAVPPRS